MLLMLYLITDTYDTGDGASRGVTSTEGILISSCCEMTVEYRIVRVSYDDNTVCTYNTIM